MANRAWTLPMPLGAERDLGSRQSVAGVCDAPPAGTAATRSSNASFSDTLSSNALSSSTLSSDALLPDAFPSEALLPDALSSETVSTDIFSIDRFLLDTVAPFLEAGLRKGERALLIATPSHTRGILERLGTELSEAATASGRLIVADARRLLAELMLDGLPRAELFHAAMSRLLGGSRPSGSALRGSGTRTRAFGELADLLWQDGNSRAATQLEALWSQAQDEHALWILLGHGLSQWGRARDRAKFLQVCRAGTPALPSESWGGGASQDVGEPRVAGRQLDRQGAELRELGVLEQRVQALESDVRRGREVEASLRAEIEQRLRVEAELRESLEREREACARARANDAFKEVFVGILGHDLRNPLNTILTTARLLILQGCLPADAAQRLERVMSSGLRMQRMIEQILDMTRDRLAMGISITRGAPRDLVPLVGKIVEEIRLANPRQTIMFLTNGACVASVDADRFEQVVSNLVGNAVAHGDPERPVHVSLELVDGSGPESHVSLGVRNQGQPVAPEFIPLLFDPFRRERKPEGRSAGLGLGLYISDRIVRAHGGRIRVESSADRGTLFEAVFPRRAEPPAGSGGPQRGA